MNNVWVYAGNRLPCGARIAGIERKRTELLGRIWLDVCILGQHLPQLYSEDELHPLTHENATSVGLCPRCLGFGTRMTFADLYPRTIDEITELCGDCEGSGRPYVRVAVTRTPYAVSGEIRTLPHLYLDREDPDYRFCLACGEPEQHKNHVTA